jgi:hypothetical protein
MKKKVRTVSPDGVCGWTSRKSADRYVKRGRAYLRDDGAYVFIRAGDAPRRKVCHSSPTVTVKKYDPRDSSSFRPNDSGQCGFARYPMPLMASSGPVFRALARTGAGL